MPKKTYVKADVRHDGMLDIDGTLYSLATLNKAIFIDSTVQFSPAIADAITALATFSKAELAETEATKVRQKKLAELAEKMGSVVEPILSLSRDAIASFITAQGPKHFRFSLVTGNVSIDIPCLAKESEDLASFQKELGEDFKSLGFALGEDGNYSPSADGAGTRAEPKPAMVPGLWQFTENAEKGIEAIQFTVLDSGRTEVEGKRITHPDLLRLANVPAESTKDPERPWPWPGNTVAKHSTLVTPA